LALAACQPKPAETTGQPATPATLAAPVQGMATAPSPSATTPAQGAPVVTQLAALASHGLAVSSPEVSGYLQTYFKDACDPDDALPFDQACQHYDEAAATSDPSPWPDLALGIKDGHIVSVVLFDPAQTLGDGWTCEAVSGPENVRACTPASVEPDKRADWLQRWSAYFSAAD
jgi:hypothetical protein